MRAVFFYAGKAFCLRCGAEQRYLKPSQFEYGYNPDWYTYTVNGSKNHRGGFGTLHDSNKVVTAYPTLVGNSSDPLWDVVYLLDYSASFSSLHCQWILCTCSQNHKCQLILKSHVSIPIWWERTLYIAHYIPCVRKQALKTKSLIFDI